jgi:hypothetical protein
MYKASQEFTFSILQNENTFHFTGQLVFASRELNAVGMLHTQEELDSFGTLLNTSIGVPEYWTLETLAEHFYTNARPVFQNLYSVNLFLTESPSKVVEYYKDEGEVDGQLLSMEAIG